MHKSSSFRHSNRVILYNMIFPIWMLWLYPMLWIIILPLNYLIDRLVLTLSVRYFKVENFRTVIQKSIWKVWLFGFPADFAGTAFLFFISNLNPDASTGFGRWYYDNITGNVVYHPFENIFSFLAVSAGIFVSGVMIYIFNRFFCLKKMIPHVRTRKKCALALAFFTAPWFFYLPAQWFYG